MTKVIKTTPKKAYEKLSPKMNTEQKEGFKDILKGSKEVHIYLDKVKEKINNKDFCPIERLNNGVTLVCKYPAYKGQFVEFEGEKYYIAKDRDDLYNFLDFLRDKKLKKIELNHIITSFITDMSELFEFAHKFNEDISNWDTSNVTNMYQMFLHADLFNGNISNWNTSKVTDMSNMFNGAKVFNQDISSWNTSKVTDMNGMFEGTKTFKQNISNWNIKKVEDFENFDKNTSKEWKNEFKPKFK